jgi:putative phosphoribosyl transferase
MAINPRSGFAARPETLGHRSEEHAVRIPAGRVELDADLVLPALGGGSVIFAHGSGSGRHSPRNRQVARVLNQRGVGTLLLDLLDSAEARVDEMTASYRFNIPLLTERLRAASDWLVRQPGMRDRPLGYFGASTGGAVAMRAAVARANVVAALVLRGARTDLGDVAAPRIRCPTLILVGEYDPEIAMLNRATMALLRCKKRLAVIPRASHLFEEPGSLEAVSRETVDWFTEHLGRSVR